MDNDLESSIGYIIGTTRRLILKTLNDAFQKNNISITIEQYVFLSILKNQTVDVTQQDMACLMCKDKSAVLRTIDILENKGLVQRLTVSGDRRKNIIKLTN
ncbi:MAG: regulatory protein MarR, partial [Daejeonella sp.]|nr:regulatory protein MarR [Daejeonella sp.]